MSVRRTDRRPRRHGVVLGPADRRALERAGWRTTLDYREDHVRGRDGRLLEIRSTWIAEAERYAGQLAVASASAETAEGAWAQLRSEIESDRAQPLARVRLLRS